MGGLACDFTAARWSKLILRPYFFFIRIASDRDEEFFRKKITKEKNFLQKLTTYYGGTAQLWEFHAKKWEKKYKKKHSFASEPVSKSVFSFFNKEKRAKKKENPH